MKQTVNTFIFSDVHLGSPLSRPTLLLASLQEYNFKRLILLGDVFEDVNFKKLPDMHWGLLKYLNNLMKNSEIEIVWIRGNHDEMLDKISSIFLGIEILDEYKWVINGKNFLVLHGHQFDRFFKSNWLFVKFLSLGYHTVAKLDTKKRAILNFLKRKSNIWFKVSEDLKRGAGNYAAKSNTDIVICGHSHYPCNENMEINGKKITYYNSGCWVEHPGIFITITEKAEVITHYIY